MYFCVLIKVTNQGNSNMEGKFKKIITQYPLLRPVLSIVEEGESGVCQ